MVRVAVTLLAGLAVTTAAAPAFAAQHPARLAGPGQLPGTSRMAPGPPWTHIAPGGDHTCATRANGTLWCWGANGDGQLGLGNQTGQDVPRQVAIPAAGGWAGVTTGGSQSCATRTNGTLWCWGYNGDGELGLGNLANQDRPRLVTTPAAGGWASVTAGYSQTCAIRTNRTLWCWGGGQDRPQQVTTPAAGGWASVTPGDGFTCATRTGGTLWCWGLNNAGQLGIGNQTNQNLPQRVTTPARDGWASVHTGEDHTCALRANHTLWCWGLNDFGQLGGGGYVTVLPNQVIAPAPGGWASIAAGYGDTCAIRVGGTLWCWGINNNGQLGLGYYTVGPGAGISTPQQVTSPAGAGWATIATGWAHTCAIRAGGTLWCWGYNADGELGIGNTTYETDLAQQVADCRQAASQHPALSRQRDS
jgi:alpha-tubulin suppressor-like RCC1 family protein